MRTPKMKAEGKEFPEDLRPGPRERLQAAIKERDTWWAAWVIGPLANHVVGRLARFDGIHPNHVTIAGAAVAVAAALALAEGSRLALLVGGFLVQAAFLLDCVDGQLARYKDLRSPFGEVLDRVLDRLKVGFYFLALAIGAYGRDADNDLLWIAAFVTTIAFFVIHVYAQQYRSLRSLAGSPASREGWDTILLPFRVLDQPFLRPVNADHLVLISLAGLFDAVPALLYFLATMAMVQLVLRPVYFGLLLRRDFGLWPWQIREPRES